MLGKIDNQTQLIILDATSDYSFLYQHRIYFFVSVPQ